MGGWRGEDPLGPGSASCLFSLEAPPPGGARGTATSTASNERSRRRDGRPPRTNLIGSGRGCGGREPRGGTAVFPARREPGAGGAHGALLSAHPLPATRAAPPPAPPSGSWCPSLPCSAVASPTGARVPGWGQGREPRDERLRWVQNGRPGAGRAGRLLGQPRRRTPGRGRPRRQNLAPGLPGSRALSLRPGTPPRPLPSPPGTPRPSSCPQPPHSCRPLSPVHLPSHSPSRPDPRPALPLFPQRHSFRPHSLALSFGHLVTSTLFVQFTAPLPNIFIQIRLRPSSPPSS